MSKNAETLKETQSSKLGISDVLRSFYEYHWKRTDVVEKFYDYHWYNTIKIAYNGCKHEQPQNARTNNLILTYLRLLMFVVSVSCLFTDYNF